MQGAHLARIAEAQNLIRKLAVSNTENINPTESSCLLRSEEVFNIDCRKYAVLSIFAIIEKFYEIVVSLPCDYCNYYL